jgi:two-component system CheB/CheR fusion protein
MLLINVTEFFRDAPAWEHLRETCCRAARGQGRRRAVRVWSAGCASGQEAYTCAMVLAELLGVDAYRERVKIYATDIDEDALAQARLAPTRARRSSRSRRSCASATSSAPTSGSRSARTCAGP